MRSSGAGIAIALVVALIVLGVGFEAWYQWGTVATTTIHVTDKQRIVDNSSDGHVKSKYLIYSDKETFQDTDALFHTKFSSSDLFGRLKVGQTYQCKVYGWRIPFLSKYRNIISCKGT